MTEYAEDLGTGKILGWYRGPRPAIYVTDPEFIKEVFIKESETFIDRPMLDRSDTIPHLINLKGMFLRAIKSLNIHTKTKDWQRHAHIKTVVDNYNTQPASSYPELPKVDVGIGGGGNGGRPLIIEESKAGVNSNEN